MARSEQGIANQKAYISRYKKEHYINLAIRLNKETDADLIEYIKTLDNITTTIKTLLRQKRDS